MTTQELIDGLIATIWHATENRSVTNIMVARVLDWLNRKDSELKDQIDQSISNFKEDITNVHGLIDQEKNMRLQADMVLSLAVNKIQGALAGLRMEITSEAEYNGLVEKNAVNDHTLYLILEPE